MHIRLLRASLLTLLAAGAPACDDQRGTGRADSSVRPGLDARASDSNAEDAAGADRAPGGDADAIDTGSGDVSPRDTGGGIADASAVDSAIPDGSRPDADASPGDAGCDPEGDPVLCSRLNIECGMTTAIDNCGAVRTASCPTCTPPESCGVTGAPNECGCTAPPDVTNFSCNISGSIRFSFSGVTTQYAYVYRNSTVGAASRCDGQGAAIVSGNAGANSLTIAGGPQAGECGFYRLCAVHGSCLDPYSAGRVIRVCVDAAGNGGCEVL